MKICTIGVGKYFCQTYSKKLKEYTDKNKNIDLIVLTDYPEYFNFCKTEIYEDDVFSYFSKNTFTAKISKKYKTDVLYVDIDSFHIIDDSLHTKQLNTPYFLYDKLWYGDYGHGRFLTYTDSKSLSSDLIDYYEITENFKIKNILEKIFYLPYSEKIDNLYKDLVITKEIWDTKTKMNKPIGSEILYSKYGIGYGEGIPLSLSLIMNGIQTMRYQLTKISLI